MVKQFLKKKSKRVSAKKRYKIEKKVKAHNRKLKRLDKQKKQGQKKGRKLIIVPGDCPFKEQILAEATLLKENILQDKLARKEKAKENRKEKREAKKQQTTSVTTIATSAPKIGISTSDKKQGAGGMSFEELIKKAQERGYQFEQVESQKKRADPSLKAFYKEFQTVVGESDVVIQVLDSRDPLGTRSSDVEESVRSHANKKLLFVLNKCDLVPVDNLEKWVTYLKHTTHCTVVPFKANTQKQKDRLGSIGAVNTAKGITDTKKSVGVNDLMGILGTWARGEAGGITVGVVGMPNVGKSSLINSLKRSRACNVGAKPGITRTCQVIHLDSKLRLVDSPGICFSKETGNEAISLEKILNRVPKNTLLLHYNIPDFQDPEEFLCNIAIKYGQLKKGGIPNTASAENKLVHDWHTGAIRFFTDPPELPSSTVSSTIVTTMSEAFSLDSFVPGNAEGTNDDEEMNDISNSNDNDDSSDVMDDGMVEEDVLKTAPASPNMKKPSPRLTRSMAKNKGVTFSVDTSGTALLRTRKSLRRQEGAPDAVTPQTQAKLGMGRPRAVLMKKIKKSKKKTAKKVDELASIVDNFSF